MKTLLLYKNKKLAAIWDIPADRTWEQISKEIKIQEDLGRTWVISGKGKVVKKLKK